MSSTRQKQVGNRSDFLRMTKTLPKEIAALSTFDKLMLYMTKIHPKYSISDFTEALYTYRREQGTLAGLSLQKIEEGLWNIVREKYSVKSVDIDAIPTDNALEESVAAALWSTFKRYREESARKPFNSAKKPAISEERCLICLEDLNSNKTETFECEHTFHRKCLEEWFKIERTCPLCRKLLLFKDEFPALQCRSLK